MRGLEGVYEQHAQSILKGVPEDRYLFESGVIAGLRLAASLPDNLIEFSKTLKDRTHDRTAAGDAIFANTPLWREHVAARDAAASGAT